MEQRTKMESIGDKSNDTKVSDDEEEHSDEFTFIEEKLDDADEDLDKRRLLRSGVWEYFDVTDIDNKTATCNLCSEPFSFRTTSTNLAKHLRRKHCIEFEKCVVISDTSTKDADPIKTGGRVSAAWEYFTVKDRDQRVATCNLCGAHFSYKTSVSNLMKHVQRKHGIVKSSDDEDENDDVVEEYENECKSPKVTPSIAWKYFTRTDPERRIATCNLCNEKRSYFSAVWNLMRHLRARHRDTYIESTFHRNADHTGDENAEEFDLGDNDDDKKTRVNPSAAWRYFTKTDPERRVATCKLCNEKRSYLSTVGNLLKHVRRRHKIDPSISRESDDENAEEMEFRETYTSNSKSPVWLYFKCIDKLKKIAVCLVCKTKLSFTTSITNLKRHLYRKHPQIKLKGNEAKKILISSGGQLYEIEETTTKQEKEDDDEQPAAIDIDSVFLEDFDGDILENDENPKPKKISRRETQRHSRTQRPQWREQVLHDDSETGTDSEITYKKRYVRKENDSLDKFGSYIISLLRQLPKELSNQLQMDFVKQIMTAQLSYESQKKVSVPNNGYAITISEPQEQDASNIEFMTVQEQVVIDGE